MLPLALIEVGKNRLKFTSEALDVLNVKSGDRIVVNYWTQDSEKTFPVIGKSELFSDKNNGNKLTNSKTVSFRGLQRTILLEYGKFFTLKPFKEFFEMIKVEEEQEPENN